MKKRQEKEYKLQVGLNTKHWREFKGIKQEDLAQRLDIDHTTLSRIENGKSDLNTHMIEDIAEALGIEVELLLKSPQQIYNINNSPNSNAGTIHGTQNVYNIDKPFMESVLDVLKKISAKLSA